MSSQDNRLGMTHTEKQGDKLWDGKYFGPDGALQESRNALTGRRLQYEAIPSPAFRRAVLSAQMVHMSTLASAIGHSAAQAKIGLKTFSPKRVFWYGWQLVMLTLELSENVAALAEDAGAVEQLEPGERDVLIASLIKMAPIGRLQFEWWYRREAAVLIRHQIKTLSFSHGASVFAKARAVEGRLTGYFSTDELATFKKFVEKAIWYLAPDGTSPVLTWSDVARLARMVGDTKRQQYAAAKDGTFDAKLKAGIINN